ncbi:DNA-binding protein [Nitrosovibrio sp. Nv6]|uniref:DNA-binding protein n=1 Tax=Nitrosovibrio sp. Nv6 TaxID=1855340 RepID=UPI0008CA8D43|nr:DNA-binding protein [Nitrosovibrio sp. Nv6]SEP43906.1 replication region DNA-binding N-term [Nitrosovibrio sp. Nv6]
MGRKALHTQEQVFDAADQLAAAGKEVTPTALREALGGGSLTTIYRHLEAWEDTRKSLPAPVSIPMPDAVKLAFNQTWQTAANEAGKEITAIREKADTEIKAANRRLEEAVAAIAQLENEQQADADRLEALETTLAGEREGSHRAVADAAARHAGLSATVEQMSFQIEGLKGELAAARSEAAVERKRHAAELSETRNEIRTLSEKLGKAHGTVDVLRAQVAEQQATIRNLSERK